MSRRLTHVIGFDDVPFHEAHRGHVLIVGVQSTRRLGDVRSPAEERARTEDGSFRKRLSYGKLTEGPGADVR
ncbi:MAG: hypothetical protein ACREYC_23960, partial [Gammaproteobacteria bacterium]